MILLFAKNTRVNINIFSLFFYIFLVYIKLEIKYKKEEVLDYET